MKNFFQALCWFVILGTLGGAQLPGTVPLPQVDPRVLEDTSHGQSADFLILLRTQADLAALSARARMSAAQITPGDRAVLHDRILHAVYGGLREEASRSQPAVLAQLKALGTQAKSYWLVNVIAVHGGNRAVVDAMAARPDVREISSNRAFRAPLPKPDPSTGLHDASPQAAESIEWNVTQVHAPEVWAAGYTGQGIRIGVADTGVQWDHPALKEHYLGWNGTTANHNYAWWDAIKSPIIGNSSCGYNVKAPCDDYGHGTHTTGTAAGSDGSTNQIGVAPGAKWMACRNMDAGVGRPSTYIECLQFFLAPTDLNGQNPNPALHADVVSNSYTCPSDPADPQYEFCDNTSLRAAVDNMRIAGIFMSVAAGNSGPSCSTVKYPPAIEASAITVGATDGMNQIASFSSRGPVTVDGSGRRKPDLVAPGVSVRSSYPINGYTLLSGTSMATPNVAGAVALLWSAFPALRGDIGATQNLLQDTALHLPSTINCGADTSSSVPNTVYGYGLINIWSAYFQMAYPYKIIFPIIFR